MLIFRTDLLCQMLAQRLGAVGTEIVVEIPETRLEHLHGNPGPGCSGGQPLRSALPGRIAVDGDVEALQPLRQQDGSEVTRRESRPDGQRRCRLADGEHGLDAFPQHEDFVCRVDPDGIAQKVTHSPPRCIDSRFVLTVSRQPGAMHALQGPCPIGDSGDQRWSGDRLGLTFIPMPALRVEAQGSARHRLGDAPGTQVHFGQRACQRHRGCEQARGRLWRATGGFRSAWRWYLRENWLRTTKMRAGLGQKFGKAGDARPLADDVEEITMISGRGISIFTRSPRPRGGTDQPDEQRATRIVLQIADHPVAAFPPPGGKIVTADAFGILREVLQQIFCFQ